MREPDQTLVEGKLVSYMWQALQLRRHPAVREFEKETAIIYFRKCILRPEWMQRPYAVT